MWIDAEVSSTWNLCPSSLLGLRPWSPFILPWIYTELPLVACSQAPETPWFSVPDTVQCVPFLLILLGSRVPFPPSQKPLPRFPTRTAWQMPQSSGR
nr:hypothetical protein CFP56_32228 [Quercus suber]